MARSELRERPQAKGKRAEAEALIRRIEEMIAETERELEALPRRHAYLVSELLIEKAKLELLKGNRR